MSYNLSFKRTTPRRIVIEARERYASYLESYALKSDLIPIEETEWYREAKKRMSPARYLKTYREIMGYSQAKLGTLVGTPGNRISDYETGRREISKEMAKKFAKVFDTTPADFI